MSTGATMGRGPLPRPFSMYGGRQLGAGASLDANGHNGGAQSAKKPSRPTYPYLDDLLRATPDCDIHASIRRLLQMADDLAKQAEVDVDFRRPHLGLQNHVRAYKLMVEIIPHHKEWPGLNDRMDLKRMFNGVWKRLNGQSERFDGVKKEIKQNNIENGVQPASLTPSPPSPGQETATPASETTTMTSLSVAGGNDGSIKRTKPVIHRKPTSLLGNVLRHQRSQSEQVSRGSSAGQNGVNDLEARFSRLRSRNLVMPDYADFPGQKLQQQKPAGPRPLPNGTSATQRPQEIALDAQILDFPRAPDAIYSPDGTNLERRSVNPPRPAPRSSLSDISRKPHNEPNGRGVSDNGSMQSSRSVAQPLPKSLQVSKPAPDPLPKALLDATMVKANEVKALMTRHKILFVDIRVRNRFDEGHIMSQSIICIEPAAIRNDMSAADLESALVLSPDNELALFRNRKKYDFIVYYDQSSISNLYAHATSDVEEETLRDFSKAVYEFDYDNNLKCLPKLLVGGLDSWIELLGERALATSHTYSSITPQTPRTVKRPLLLSSHEKTTYQSRLALDEEKQWKDKLASPDAEFAGRFPDLQTFETQHTSPSRTRPSNSMTDQSQFMAAQAAELNRYAEPSRPPPSLHRPSFKGVSGDDHHTTATSNEYFPEVKTISHVRKTGGRRGLYNFGNTCYMNSVLQALSNTDWLCNYFIRGEYTTIRPLPQKKGELSSPPQIMSQTLATVLCRIWQSDAPLVKPNEIKNYIYALCRSKNNGAPSQELFGGPMQQDAMEFFAFILDILDDENNLKRDKPDPPPLTKEQERMCAMQQTYHNSFVEHWNRFSSNHKSVFSQHMAVSTMQISQCGSCGYRWPNHDQPKYYLTLNLPQKGREVSLQEILAKQYNSDGRLTEVTEDFSCENCTARTGRKVTRKVSETITRLPDTLVFALVRNIWTESGTQSKNEIVVRFPLEVLDMESYYYGLPPTSNGAPRTKYRCHAVVQHHGKAVNEGHYTTLVRDRDEGKNRTRGERMWWKFNDQRVEARHESETQKASSYLLFYERIN